MFKQYRCEEGAHLSEFADLNLNSTSIVDSRYGFYTDFVAVSQRVKQVVGCLCGSTALLRAKNEVNPRVQLRRNVGRFESLSVELNVGLRCRGPGRQNDIVDFLPVLPCA
jgi:hypothetical protein